MTPTPKPGRPPCPDAGRTAPWQPYAGGGRYRNPVIFADYADLDVIGVGEDFYLTASSFHCTPGLPILHSRDLVNWRIVGHALRNLPHARYRRVQVGSGVWAPSIRCQDGRFLIYFAMPDEGVFLVQSERAEGPWTDPICVLPGKGIIDPCPLWDEDGRAYLVHAYAQSRSGIKHRLCIRDLSWDGTRAGGQETIIADGEERFPTIEGPKFLKKDGWYYIFAPVGGVTDGWQSVLRARHVHGPYEYRVVMVQGRTPINGPHQGAVLEDGNGDWWFMHFQDRGVYGRVAHLQPLEWGADEWPRIGTSQDIHGVGEPVLEHDVPSAFREEGVAVPQCSDDFASGSLGLQWQWNANHEDWWAMLRGDGRLRLLSQPCIEPSLDLHPGVLGQKFPAPRFTVDLSLVDAAGDRLRAGLLVMGSRSAGLIVCRNAESGWELRWVAGQDETLIARIARPWVHLRLTVEIGGVCSFHWRVQEVADWQVVPGGFQAVAGVWIGARFGLVAAGERGGFADFTAVTVGAIEGPIP